MAAYKTHVAKRSGLKTPVLVIGLPLYSLDDHLPYRIDRILWNLPFPSRTDQGLLNPGLLHARTVYLPQDKVSNLF